MDSSNRITYFAETDARNKRVKFGIKDADRLKHIYSIGKTGMGKSTMLENMVIQDIQNGNGLAFLDPHGKTADLLLDYIPESRIKDVIYFAPFDIDHPIAFNVMEDVGETRRHLVLSGLMSAFEKVFGEESFSDRMQYILQNTILALLEYPGATMLGINKMLSDKSYREKVIANITDVSVKNYWTKEFAGYTDRFAADAIPAIQNKVGQFTSNPIIRNIIGQPKSSFDIRKAMDEKKILIVNLSKGLVGESNANLLGSMLVTKIYLAAMSRADKSPQDLAKLPNFYLYVDEFQSFANKSFADILSEARKYKLSLNITHQYVEQMDEEVKAAVFGNIGTMISFRVGSFDAEILEKEFAPTFTMEDIVNLGFTQVYLRLMIDGVGSQPFSATTLPPIQPTEASHREEVISYSRSTYTSTKEQVENAIREWNEPGAVGGAREENRSPSAGKMGAYSGERPRDDRRQDGPREERRGGNINGDKREKEAPPEGDNSLGKAILEALKTQNESKPEAKPENKPAITEESPKLEAGVPEPKLKPIQLTELKKDERNKNKEATPEKRNALKEALEKAAKEHASAPAEKPKEQPKQEAPQVKIEPKIEVKQELKTAPVSEQPKVVKEIPEEVLRKVLNS